MLQQILDDMYVDPDLLGELDEEQKQLLFCKMREEQVRRWNLHEEQQDLNPPESKKKPGGKRVTFLVGGDGEPVVVVLGGGRDDVDTLLQERARRQADMEADVLKKAAEEELDKLVRLSRSTVQAMEKDATRQQNKKSDPTREAVVKSLQEATQEMEKHIESLDSPGKRQPITDNQTTIAPPTPPPSPPTKSPVNPNDHGLVTALPAVTISPYGSSHQPSQGKKMPSLFWDKSKFSTNKPNTKENSLNRFSSSNISPPSSISSECSSTPSPPPTLPSESLQKELQINEHEMSSETQKDLEVAEGVATAVADQIRRWEQLSEGSLEALKTATLERAKKHRQKEILEHLRLQVDMARKQAAEAARINQEKEDAEWREQERKAKEAEKRIREIARRAREEHRRTSIGSNSSNPSSPSTELPQAINHNLNGVSEEMLIQNGLLGMNGFSNFHPGLTAGRKLSFDDGDINGNVKNSREDSSNNNLSSSNSSTSSICSSSSSGYNSGKSGSCIRQRLRPPKPPSKAAIVTWFREEELSKGSGLDDSNANVATWFHGIISRVEAEEILQSEKVGSFLVRVSERIWGYAISYRAVDRCRHYLIDASGEKYTFLGSHQAAHNSLRDLVDHHRREPITNSGGEILVFPCGQSNPKRPDHLELFTGTQYLTL